MGLVGTIGKSVIRRLSEHPVAPRIGNFILREHSAARRKSLKPAGIFMDSRGHEHQMFEDLRPWIVPLWVRSTSTPASDLFDPEKARENCRSRMNHVRTALPSLIAILETWGFGLEGKHVLEVGCGHGEFAFGLAEFGASEVVGTNLAQYYEHEGSKERLEQTWSTLSEVTGISRDRVSFVFDDVAQSELEPESFDMIFTNEVLEHLVEYPKAFAGMASLLKPGGVALHEYNPFFCATGGHLDCTLDIPWGHARLSPEDFERYLETYRPDELQDGLDFFHKGLNRMTFRNLEEASSDSGLQLLELLPWIDKEDVDQVDARLLEEVRHLYPTATIRDLTSRFVWALHQKGSP